MKLINCPECQVLFVPEENQEVCVKCLERYEKNFNLVNDAMMRSGMKSAEEIAEFTMLNLAAVDDVEQKIVKVQRRPESYLKGVGMRSSLEMKCQRTGSHRFDPSPKQRKW